jgi:TonB family protein
MKSAFFYFFICLYSPFILSQNEGIIYENPDLPAKYTGGMDSVLAYLERNVVYPEISIKQGDEGIVQLDCIVELNGKLSVVGVKQSVSPELDAETIRLVQNMPNWRPAYHDGQAVRSPLIISLEYNLASEKAKRKKARKLKKSRRKL